MGNGKYFRGKVFYDVFNTTSNRQMSFNIFLFLKFNRKFYNRISFFLFENFFVFPTYTMFHFKYGYIQPKRLFHCVSWMFRRNSCLFWMPFSLHSVSDCALRVSAGSEQTRWGDSNASPVRQVYQWLLEQLTELSKLLWIHYGFGRTRERWLFCGNVFVLYFGLTS